MTQSGGHSRNSSSSSSRQVSRHLTTTRACFARPTMTSPRHVTPSLPPSFSLWHLPSTPVLFYASE
ncbi:hypothetical protein E2C01_082055 [Portunus trituberculatus]|uniref:Uncharacterized protein n=1 Tax=Portunus trituberculatus TaxID=210409 RepID=A0A5B7IY22_PORTR|nr:hypothetical protein [Portunus trituberculatus]